MNKKATGKADSPKRVSTQRRLVFVKRYGREIMKAWASVPNPTVRWLKRTLFPNFWFSRDLITYVVAALGLRETRNRKVVGWLIDEDIAQAREESL